MNITTRKLLWLWWALVAVAFLVVVNSRCKGAVGGTGSGGGGLSTTNAKFAGAVLYTDGSILYWASPTGAGATNVATSKTWWVDRVIGLDSNSGTNISAPLLTVTNAKSRALSGDVIVVRPGRYVANDLAKDGVNWLLNGVTLAYTNTTSRDGIFDDKGTAMSFFVSGDFDIVHCPGTNLLVKGAIVSSNANSKFWFKGKNLYFGQTNAPSPYAAINVINCQTNFFRFDELYDFEIGNTNDFDGLEWTHEASGAGGVYWNLGDVHLDIKRITTDGGYCVWGDEPTPGGTAANFYADGDKWESKLFNAIYMSTFSTAYRAWFDVDEILAQNVCLSGIGPARWYVDARKLQAVDVISGNGNFWVTAQKATCTGGSGHWITLNHTNSDVFIAINQYESLGTMGSGFRFAGSGRNIIQGGFANLTGATTPIVEYLGGPTLMQGLTLMATNTAAVPFMVYSNLLQLQDCAIFGNASTNSLVSTNARQVEIIGTLTQNLPAHTNVTLVPPNSSLAQIPAVKVGMVSGDYNAVTEATTVNLNLLTNTVQTLTLAAGNLTLNSTNRPSTGWRSTLLLVTASGAARTVTLNGSWKVYGTNATSFVIPSGKEAAITIHANGSAETNVRCEYAVAN